MVALAYEGNLIKSQGNKALVPMLSQTMEGWKKDNQRTKKKFSVGIDDTEVLAGLGVAWDATEVVKTVGNYTLIELYYLMRVGEYKLKGKRNDMKQTVQLKLEDTISFDKMIRGVCANYQSIHPIKRFCLMTGPL